MNRNSIGIFTIFVALGVALAAIGGCSTAKPSNSAPERFSELAPGIARCAQPTPAEWVWLKSRGYTNDIKLNTEREASDEPAEALGFTVIRCPIGWREEIFGMTDGERSNLVWVVHNLWSAGTVLHCTEGQDRTGLAAGIKRRQQGWSPASAQAEMLRRGFHRIYVGLWEAWEDVKAKP